MVETIKGRVFEIGIVWGSQAEAPSGLARSLIIEIEVIGGACAALSGLARPFIIGIEVIGAAKRRSESPERAQHNSPGR